MKARSGFLQAIFPVLLLLLVSGCASIGPNRVKSDRLDYSNAIAGSWRTQTLLAIVKLRYSEWPVFLDLEQVVTQYTFEHTGTARGIFRISEYEQGELGYVGKFSERPVMLYKPLKGARYMKSMLTPIPLPAILGLIQTGWPADRMLETMLHSANGYRNTQLEEEMELRPDPVFAQFLQTLRAFQVQDALVIDADVIEREGKEAKINTRITFRVDRVNDEAMSKLAELRKEMALAPATNTYNVIWGVIPPNEQTIAFESRSVLQLMVVLAAHVDVPEEEVAEGRLYRLNPRPKYDASGLGPLIAVKRGNHVPADAFASCKYRGDWFWIDDTDVNSKHTFSYLTLLLTLGDVDKDAGAQLVITTN